MLTSATKAVVSARAFRTPKYVVHWEVSEAKPKDCSGHPEPCTFRCRLKLAMNKEESRVAHGRVAQAPRLCSLVEPDSVGCSLGAKRRIPRSAGVSELKAEREPAAVIRRCKQIAGVAPAVHVSRVTLFTDMAYNPAARIRRGGTPCPAIAKSLRTN